MGWWAEGKTLAGTRQTEPQIVEDIWSGVVSSIVRLIIEFHQDAQWHPAVPTAEKGSLIALSELGLG